jgi:hypothetical protein
MLRLLIVRNEECSYAASDISFWVPNRLHRENSNEFVFQFLLSSTCLSYVLQASFLKKSADMCFLFATERVSGNLDLTPCGQFI